VSSRRDQLGSTRTIDSAASKRKSGLVRTVVVGAAVLAAMCGTALGATSTSLGGRPVIGAPRTTPRRPAPSKRFRISFAVHTGAGRSLTNAVVSFKASIAGRSIAHTDSFVNSVASTSLSIPASAGGKSLTLTLAVAAQGAKATRTARFAITGSALPAVAVEDATVSEGNAGTAVLSFPVTLSASSSAPVTLSYTTQDGTATAGSDYVAQSGRLVFSPGEVTKSIAVIVNGDTTIEPDETLYVVLTDPSNSKLLRPVATGTILNDDVASPVSAGDWKGTTAEANYLYFTVLPDRTVNDFRIDSITENCNDGVYLQGSIDWGVTLTIPIDTTGNFVGQGSWSGSDVEGDVEFTSDSWTVKGQFTSASAVTGSISLDEEFNWHNTHYTCSGSIGYTAALQG
jgi:hypothetical protein